MEFEGWVEPPHVPPPPDTGRGKVRLTDVDAKLAGWACEDQLEI